MSPGSTRLPPLGELETAALDHLWTAGEADVQSTHAAIGVARGISVNTVGSALERLYRKQLVVRDKVSHAYRYRPSLSREAFHAQRMLEAAGGLGALRERGLLATFVNLVADGDEEALDELERLVRARRGGAQT